eukprot:1196242-Ditylum_brightwellii.AAC.1
MSHQTSIGTTGYDTSTIVHSHVVVDRADNSRANFLKAPEEEDSVEYCNQLYQSMSDQTLIGATGYDISTNSTQFLGWQE